MKIIENKKAVKDKKYTTEDLKIMQNWSLERKTQVTQTRILEWYQHYDNNVYVSFSGGKDSTVLADLVARFCKANGNKLILVFVNTGLEYPEIRKFVKEYTEWLGNKYDIVIELEILCPKKYNRKEKKWVNTNFKEVILKYGYPIISKKVSNSISRFRLNPAEEWRYNKFINGINQDGTKTQFVIPKKWQDVALNAPFSISDNCCAIMKHKPCIQYEQKTGNYPIIAMMADDDKKREQAYRETGCNAFELDRPMSNPMGFWTEQDVLTYLKKYNIPYCSVYGEIIKDENDNLKMSGVQRTGCMFCGFGIDQQEHPNRFEQMKITHPKQYNYCINGGEFNENGKWIPNTLGLGLGKVLDYINVKYGDENED